ncbi:MAG: hypothetical protein FIA97_15465 [Methylococcaceae bacterium]|nr:hypothetical protein [Methylococcaceae bacterium]
MNLQTKLAAAIVMTIGASMAQATTYNVSAVFFDGGVQGVTTFKGSFDWNGSTVSNFNGMLSESMFAWRDNDLGTGKHWWDPLSNFNVNNTYINDIYDSNNALGTYHNGDAPLLHLTFDNLVPTSISGNQVTAMTFLKNSTNVVMGGGYDVWGTDPDIDPNNAMAYGMPTQTARNNNGFFTLVFDKNDPTNTSLVWDQMVYADETRLGMMGPYMTGWLGMTGHKDYGGGVGSMGGYPQSLSITAVPVPAAVWLFGSALLSLFGVNRRKSVLSV